VVGDVEEIHAVLQIREEPGGDRFHHVDGAPLRGFDRRPVDRDQFCERSTVHGLGVGPARLAGIAESVVEPLVAGLRAQGGLELEQLLPSSDRRGRGHVRCRSLLVLP
jgi:hypothetical protein